MKPILKRFQQLHIKNQREEQIAECIDTGFIAAYNYRKGYFLGLARF
ncbi:hypothetical protein [Agrobacterium vitis]|nr:hypothetical protein [Agrobacterium vitis]MCM2451384.1 hypothetical protein [Agrobacterium vitis]MCM2469212.1 hypothetical protein [Agrobacterium vitis]MUO69385.1 hypothetical protein [Agrobacterium vitis]MUO83865.1 hypothetical protein [Agrobacterium vitis]MVA36455.1 hypothetical protein [Agrobacterium vitis]